MEASVAHRVLHVERGRVGDDAALDLARCSAGSPRPAGSSGAARSGKVALHAEIEHEGRAGIARLARSAGPTTCGGCASGTSCGTAWAKSPFTTTASAAMRAPPTSTPRRAAALEDDAVDRGVEAEARRRRVAPRAPWPRHRAAAAARVEHAVLVFQEAQDGEEAGAAERAHAQVFRSGSRRRAACAGRGSGARRSWSTERPGCISGRARSMSGAISVGAGRRRAPAPGGRPRACARFSSMKGRTLRGVPRVDLRDLRLHAGEVGRGVDGDRPRAASKTRRYCGSRRISSTSSSSCVPQSAKISPGCAGRGRRWGRGRSGSPRAWSAPGCGRRPRASFSSSVTRSPGGEQHGGGEAAGPGADHGDRGRGRWKAGAWAFIRRGDPWGGPGRPGTEAIIAEAGWEIRWRRKAQDGAWSGLRAVAKGSAVQETPVPSPAGVAASRSRPARPGAGQHAGAEEGGLGIVRARAPRRGPAAGAERPARGIHIGEGHGLRGLRRGGEELGGRRRQRVQRGGEGGGVGARLLHQRAHGGALVAAELAARAGRWPGCRSCPHRSARCARRADLGGAGILARSPCRHAPGCRGRRPPRRARCTRPWRWG